MSSIIDANLPIEILKQKTADNWTITRSLRPTTSQATTRYDTKHTVNTYHTAIPAGRCLRPVEPSLDPAPQYLPDLWTAATHPEGQLYFTCAGLPPVVTEAYMYTPATAARVVFWVSAIKEMMLERGIPHSDSVELFIRIEDISEDREDLCEYYFVDHATRTQFWMDQLDTDLIDLPPVVSPSHLKLALEELYWNHLENFPMHLNGLSPAIVDELISIFLHGRADRMTSRVSTFPYTIDECGKFVSLLKDAREHLTDGHSTTFIARIWGVIARHRFNTHYGQEQSRLSRNQAILNLPGYEQGRVFSRLSTILFKTPESYLAKFNELFMDDLVYIDQWHIFIAASLKDWKSASTSSFLALLLHIVLFYIPMASSVLGALSASTFSASIIASTILTHQHEDLAETSASDAADYLFDARSETSGFQRRAMSFALPKGLYFLGLATFFLHWLIIVAFNVNVFVAGSLAIFLLFLVSPIPKPSHWVPNFCRKNRKLEDEEM